MQFEVIVQSEGGAKGFSPALVQAQVGDSVYWFNADQKAQHQPYLVKPGDWAVNPIEPQQPSTQVNTDTPATYHYRCAMHPDETGVIVVCTAVMIGPVGDGTSAFSMAPGINPLLPVPQLYAGTSVSFGNSDDKPHWPMPQVGSKEAWFPAAIEPGDISAPVPFDSTQNLTYQCALHPAETGQLQVVSFLPVTIGPVTPAPSVGFTPQSIQIGAGQAVMWSNTDGSPHQPAPDSGSDTSWFKTQITPGQNGSYTFNKPGTYPYHDVLNPNMTGIVQVGVPQIALIAIGPVSAGFTPEFTQVVAGQAVTWSNTDSSPHQPAPDAGSATSWFETPIAAAQNGSYIFNTPGTYPYHDVLNPSMKGIIQVGQK
jgi:plastocyanin